MRHSHLKRFSLISVLVLLTALVVPALAAPGDLDPTFGGSGYVVTGATGSQEFTGVVQQPDGKLVAVGYDTGAGRDFAVVRYSTGGTLDGTFGTSGKVVTSFGSGNDIANAVALQADGNIVAAGSATYGATTVIAVARYLSPTGTLDPSFGAGGLVTTTIGASATANAVAIQADGKIVVAGEANALFAVVRYNTNGTLDAAFDTDGIVTTSVGGANDIAHAVIIQTDQKIVAIGETDNGSTNDFALVRYETNGVPDSTFDFDGIVLTDFGVNDLAYAAALQPDGKIVAAGSTDSATTSFDFAVARYNTNGSPDTTFNTTGRASVDFGATPAGADEAHGVGVQLGGKIVLGGWSNQGATLKYDFALARFTPSGALDPAFGTGGRVLTNLPTNADDLGYGLTVQSDNQIVLVGSSDPGTATAIDFAIARYQSPNNAPTVSNVSKSGLEDQVISFTTTDFTAHFSDIDSDLLDRIQITSLPANGTLRLSGIAVTLTQEISAANLGNLTFTPAANFNGNTSFGWNGYDGQAYAATGANVNLSLTAVNDAPSFTKGVNQTALEDSGARSVTDWATSISAGPSDESGQVITFTLTNDNSTLFAAQPALNPIGTLTFTPAANASGSATITVTLKDSGGTANGGVDTSASQTFQVTVTPVNDAPSFTAGSNQTVAEDAGAQTVNGWATSISPGPNEVGQSLLFSVVSDNNALFSVPPTVNALNGNLTYTPGPNLNGTAHVTVTLQDNGGTANGGVDTSAPQSFTITITPVNDPPVVSSYAVNGVEDVAVTFTAADFTGHYSDVELDPMTKIRITALPATGTLKLSNVDVTLNQEISTTLLGGLTFNPAANWNGSTSFGWNGFDGAIYASANATVTLNIAVVNDAPTFTKGADQTFNEDSGTHLTTGWATNISAGPSDEAGQTLTFTLVTSNDGLFSSLPTLNLSGDLAYTFAANAFGSATVTATLQDSGGTANGGHNQSAQTFILTAAGINDAPSFVAGTDQTVNEDAGATTINNWATNVSAGPNEAGQTITFTVFNNNNALFSVQPAVSPSGTLTFTPAPNAHGSANVSLSLSDNGGTANGGQDTSAPQSFVITVNSVNDAPSFTPGTAPIVNEDSGAQTIAGWATNFSPGPADEVAQTLAVTVTAANPGLFSAQPAVSLVNGNLTFTPAPDQFGSTIVTVTLQDNGGTANGGADTVQQTFTLTVTAVNDAPSFAKGADQTIMAGSGAQTITGFATAISAGPANEVSQVLTFVISTTDNSLFSALPAINPATGTLTYTPAAGKWGTVTVTVMLKDNGGTANGGVDTSAPQTFKITIQAYQVLLPLVVR